MQNRDVRLAAMLSAQVLGFDRFFEEDSEAALSLLSDLSELFDRFCAEHRGRVVRAVRDSYLVEFPTAWDAVRCSLDIQRAAEAQFVERRSQGCGLTIGIHTGDVHFLENDAAGETIVIAAKLQSMARPGTTSISEEVYRSVSERLEVPARFSGEVALEGSAVKLRTYEIDTSTVSPPRTGTSRAASNVEDFDEVKRFVLDQIKRVGRRISTEKARAMLQSTSPELDEAIEKLADMGFLSRGTESIDSRGSEDRENPHNQTYSRADREAWREARHAFRDAIRESRSDYRHHAHRHHHSDHSGVGIDEPDFARYRERVVEQSHRAVGGFVGHLIPFLVVNGFLFFLNLSTGFGFPWFLFPLGGWAIGLISHLVSVGTRRREKREVEALPETLDETDYKLVRRFHHARASLRATLGSTISVAAFLLMVNLITSPGFLWALFPIAGLFIAIATTVASYASKRGGFRKRLKELFASKGSKRASRTVSDDTLGGGQVDEQDPPVVRQAVRIANSILEQSKKLDPERAYLGEDLEPLLLNYIGQIRTLSHRGEEVEEIMAAIPRLELKRDLDALRKRFEHATDPSLKREYKKSIEQIERQNRSFSELESQKELLELRITGSVNSLKQMQIDLARMTGISSAQELDSIGRLRERSGELNEYLHDLSEGYEEIGGLPESGELERKRADELLKEFKAREEGSQPDSD